MVYPPLCSSMKRHYGPCLILVALLLLTSALPITQAEEVNEMAVGFDDSPTWVDCWAGHNAGDMDAENQSFCSTNYAAAPSDRLYGIRWIYLNVSADDVPEDWAETQLTNLNAVFAKWDFLFQTSEEIVIPDAVAESGDYYDEWTVQEFLPDLRAQLNLSNDDAEAFAELKSQLAARHVSQEELDNLTLDDEYNTGLAFRIASRARAEDITVIIRPNLAAGGKSGGPHDEFQSLLGAGIELNSGLLSSDNLVTLPHEVGHYFGVSHTHITDVDEAETEFDFDNLVSRMEFGGDAIKRIVGDDYSQPFGEPWPMFDGSAQDLEEYQQLLSEALVWPAWQMTYHGDHQNFANLFEFMAAGEADEPIYRKNFYRNNAIEHGSSVEWYGNNCQWNMSTQAGQCRYHEPLEVFTYDHPTIKDVMWFENGTISNLMSYITPPYSDVSTRAGLSSNQVDKMRFSANTPMRLLLINHCLGTDLCGEPDDDVEPECTPGDTQPAEDGCNTCVCTEDEIWVCTLIGCPDDGVDRIPRISLWPGKVNQHNVNGTWLTDPDGISGGHPTGEYPNDYGGREVEYCQKFWPTTTQVVLQDHRESLTFYTEGNKVAYNTTKDVWICQTEDGGIPEFDPVDNPPLAGDEEFEEDDNVPYEDEPYERGRVPGFGMAATFSMLGAAALLRRRRIEV